MSQLTCPGSTIVVNSQFCMRQAHVPQRICSGLPIVVNSLFCPRQAHVSQFTYLGLPIVENSKFYLRQVHVSQLTYPGLPIVACRALPWRSVFRVVICGQWCIIKPTATKYNVYLATCELRWPWRTGHRISSCVNNDDVKWHALRSDKHEPHQEHRLGTVSHTITGGGA